MIALSDGLLHLGGNVLFQSGGVAYFAHIGGLGFGLLTIRAWIRSRGGRPRAPASGLS